MAAMNAAVLAEEISLLKATLAQREARIERLEFDLATAEEAAVRRPFRATAKSP